MYEPEFKVEGNAPKIQQKLIHKTQANNLFVWFVYLIEIAIIILYATCTEFGPTAQLVGQKHSWFVETAQYTEDDLTQEQKVGVQQSIRLYPTFQDIHVMIFIGFGFLMTYLRSHSWTSVGMNLLASAFSIQVFILSKGFWKRATQHALWSDQIPIVFTDCIFADFSAGSVMITYGALLGQVNAFQLIFVALIEVFFYALNEVLVFEELQVLDTGGSMNIHTFGAAFGIVLGCIMRPKRDNQYIKENHNAEGGYVSNVFSFLGTMFLWMYWPSFNSAPTALQRGQQRTIVCTILALSGSCITAYLVSFCQRAGFTKFGIEDLLNATLAGGVMIGATADLLFDPYAAILIGCFAGVVSAYGFAVLGGKLVKTFGMYDTCGVTHLHFLPGMLGGLISAVVLGSYSAENLGGEPIKFFQSVLMKSRSPQQQAQIQVACTFISIGIAVGAAIVTGILLKLFDSCIFQGINVDDMFMDVYFWEDAHHQDDVVLEKPQVEFVDNGVGNNQGLNFYVPNQNNPHQEQDDENNRLFTVQNQVQARLNENMQLNLERLDQFSQNQGSAPAPFEISNNHQK